MDSAPIQSSTAKWDSIAIRCCGLTKAFNGRDYVLQDVDLEIPRGQLTAIIGFSGTGKSVIIKHFLGLLKPTAGSVYVLGQDISAMDVDELTLFRRQFGVLFQGSALFDDMNVLENVCFPLVEHRPDLRVSQMIELAQHRLQQVGMDPRHFDKLPSQISGGMQKRTGLARALVLNPEIMFFDEPTTGLDPILTQMVDNLIKETHRLGQERQNGSRLTTVIVSHDIEAAFEMANFVVMLHQGKVICSGPPETLERCEIPIVMEFIAKGKRAR